MNTLRIHGALILALSAGCVAPGSGVAPAAESAALSASSRPVADGLATVAGGLGAFIAEVPVATVPSLDLPMALSLVAMPLSCIDRPHSEGRDRSVYLDDVTVTRRPGYERDRAFYGCWDWHSAVNSTWAMVRVVKLFPELSLEKLVREKLRRHLAEEPLAGELAFFEENRTFERPYGWAWLMLLQAELRTWDDPEAGRWAANLEPLTRLLTERSVQWLQRIERPSRSGTHSNTAFALAMMLDAANEIDGEGLASAVREAARRLYLDDTDCPTAYEPWSSDFLSPCLEEAKLMARVLAPEEFPGWFERFMPSLDSAEFLPLTTPVVAASFEAEGGVDAEDRAAASAEPDALAAASGGPGGADPGEDDELDRDGRRQEATRVLAARSHLIGLAFIRAEAMLDIAAALPAADPRAVALVKLADVHGEMGFAAMFDADYAGSHWIGTFALKYLLARMSHRPS